MHVFFYFILHFVNCYSLCGVKNNNYYHHIYHNIINISKLETLENIIKHQFTVYGTDVHISTERFASVHSLKLHMSFSALATNPDTLCFVILLMQNVVKVCPFYRMMLTYLCFISHTHTQF